MIRAGSSCSDTHSVLCIKEKGLSLGLVHQRNEKRQKWTGEQFWLCTTKNVALGLTVIFQENANVGFNYFNFLSRFDSIEWNMLPTGPVILHQCWTFNECHDPNIQKKGVNPKAKHMTGAAFWCNLTMMTWAFPYWHDADNSMNQREEKRKQEIQRAKDRQKVKQREILDKWNMFAFACLSCVTLEHCFAFWIIFCSYSVADILEAGCDL